MVLGVVVVLVVGLRIALPTLVERGAAYASRYWIGLPIRIDNADFALFDGRVVLEGVSIAADPDSVEPRDAALTPPPVDPATALLHVGRVSAHLSWGDLREGRIHLTEVVVETPSVRVIREDDGAVDPMRHAKPLAPPPAQEEAPQPAPASEPWAISVDRFALSTPAVVVVDPPSGQNILEFALDQFALERVTAKGSDLALGGVDIEGPVLRVRRDLALAAPTAPRRPRAAAGQAPTAAAPAGTAPAPAGYHIEKVDIERASVTWVTDKGPIDVAIALKASGITADEGKHFPIDLQLEIAKGHVGLAGEVGILPPSYTGKITWSGLPFPPLLLASLPDLAAWLRSADSSGDLTIDADVAGVRGPPALHLSGRATIETLAIADPGDKEVALGWKQLEVVMKEVLVPLPEEGKPARTTVANLDLVHLVEPKIRYTRPSPSLNALLGITPPPPAAPPAAAASATVKVAAATPTAAAAGGTAPAPTGAAGESAKAPATRPPGESPPTPVDVAIASLKLDAGDMEVIDTTVAPPVTSTVRDLWVSARDVHFPDPSASDISIRATLPKASVLTVDGNLRAGNNGDFTLSLQKLDLPVFSPYATAAGASLDAGQVSVKTRVQLRGKVMQLDNDLVLRKFGVSLHDPSSFDRNFGMPIDLALALMRDPAGDIRLKIPVKVDEKGAELSMGTIIASALKAALLGAVTAPLKLLGATFGSSEGGGGLAIAPIGSDAGGDALAADAASRVDGLAKLLSQRPSMGLVLRGRTGPADTPLVAEQILIERIKAGDGLPDVEGSGFLARRRISQALLVRDKTAPQKKKKAEPAPLSAEDQALYDRYIAAVQIPAARLDALARARAEKAQGLLLARKIDPKRVSVGDREADGDPGVVISLRAK